MRSVVDSPAPSRARSFTLRAGLLLTVAMFAANVSNYLFQVFVGRYLGPDEYGLLSSIFTMIVIVGVAMSSLQAAFAKAEASRRDHIVFSGERRSFRAFADPTVRIMLAASSGLGLVLVAASPFLGRFFHSAAGPIVMFAALVPSAALLSLSIGRLQGMERFIPLAVLSLGIAAAKLAMGTAAVLAGFGVTSIVGVITLVTGGGAFAALLLTSDAPPLVDRAIFGDVARALIALTLFRTVVGIDIPLARHWLPHDEAGQYAAASVIGKGVLWLPDIVALVVFPELATAIKNGQHAHRLLLRAAALSLAVCLVGCAALAFAGDYMFESVFGGDYVGAGPLAWKLALVSTPLAVANLLIFFHVAGRGWVWLGWLALVLGGQVAMLIAFHSTQNDFVIASAIAAVALVVGLGIATIRTSTRRAGVGSMACRATGVAS